MLNNDFKEFARLLGAHHVEYMVVGGYAMMAHGHPRFTGDIDFWVRPSEQNAQALVRCLDEFGMSALGLTEQDFLKTDVVIQLGYAPMRIDLMTSISGVDFDEAYPQRLQIQMQGIVLSVIGLEAFIQNKKTVGRHKDLGDIEMITGRPMAD
jgi:hypothetical protein